MAVSCLLGSAKRQMNFSPNRRSVDIEDARIHVAHRHESLVDVLCVDGSREIVGNIIRDFDRVLEVICRDHRNDGPEDLFLGDPHFWGYIAKQRWLVKESLRILSSFEPVPTRKYLGSFLLADLNIS